MSQSFRTCPIITEAKHNSWHRVYLSNCRLCKPTTLNFFKSGFSSARSQQMYHLHQVHYSATATSIDDVDTSQRSFAPWFFRDLRANQYGFRLFNKCSIVLWVQLLPSVQRLANLEKMLNTSSSCLNTPACLLSLTPHP